MASTGTQGHGQPSAGCHTGWCEPVCPNPPMQVNSTRRLHATSSCHLLSSGHGDTLWALSLRRSSHAKQASGFCCLKKKGTKPHLKMPLRSTLTEMHLDTVQPWNDRNCSKSSCQNLLPKLRADRQLCGCQREQRVGNMAEQFRKGCPPAPGLDCQTDRGYGKVPFQGLPEQGHQGEFHLLSSAGWAASPLQAHWLLLPHFGGSSRNSQQQGLSKLPPHQHDLRAAAGKGRGRSKGESVTASGDPRGSTSAAVRNGDTVRTKGQERPSPQQCQEPPTGRVLMKTQFSVCTLGGLIPLAEFRWAVKRPNFIPGPNLIPSGFKQCFQRAHGSHRGDARLLKEASAAHRAKQGGKGTARSPPQPRGPRPLCAANVLGWGKTAGRFTSPLHFFL